MADIIEKRTCMACRKSKVRCSKDVPCTRCLRLGLNCVEQVRGRGRPLVSYMLAPAHGTGTDSDCHNSDLDSSLHSDCSSLPPHSHSSLPPSSPHITHPPPFASASVSSVDGRGGGGGGGQAHWQQQQQQQQQEAELGLVHHEPQLHQQRSYQQSLDHQQQQQQQQQQGSSSSTLPALHEFFLDPMRTANINRRKLLIVLRAWGMLAAKTLTKSTSSFPPSFPPHHPPGGMNLSGVNGQFFHILQGVASTFGLDLQDVLHLEPEVYAALCEGNGRNERRGTAGGAPREVPMYIKALDCEAFAVSRRVLCQGESSFTCNEVFSSMFATKAMAERSPERATGIDIWLGCIDSEDRKEFLHSFLSTLLASPSPCTETAGIFKCKDKNGRVIATHLRLRSYYSQAGDYVAYSLFLAPLPPVRLGSLLAPPAHAPTLLPHPRQMASHIPPSSSSSSSIASLTSVTGPFVPSLSPSSFGAMPSPAPRPFPFTTTPAEGRAGGREGA